MTEHKFLDPSYDYRRSCPAEYPHDTAEDIFLDARLRVKLPPELAAFKAMLDRWSLELFREFWKDYEEQEGNGKSSRTFGGEAAIRLLQTLTSSRDRRTAMRAECYMAVINMNEESQTAIAKKYGVTRAAISKIIVQIKDDIGPSAWKKVGLPVPARHMKSDTARESYRKRATRIHKEKKEKLCKTKKINLFSKFWTSTQDNLPQQTIAPSN